MYVKTYDYLPEDAKKIRLEVFVEEQGFQNELDDTDNIATHLVLYDNDAPIATCRVFEGKNNNEYILGRLAVIKDYRGNNIGKLLIKEAEKCVLEKQASSLILHAQCRVKNFYEKSGYCEFGEIEDDEGCPHIWMKKDLKED